MELSDLTPTILQYNFQIIMWKIGVQRKGIPIPLNIISINQQFKGKPFILMGQMSRTFE